jgi:outer membrane protein assembly factor BamB
MMNRRNYRLLSVPTAGLLMALASAAVAESNWPKWRGPLTTGEAGADASPPSEWSQKQNVKWKVKLPGSGSSTPIIWGNQIFIQTAVSTGSAEKKADVAAPPASAAGDGNREGRRGRGGFGGGAAPTSAYRFVLLCLDRNTGEIRWEQTARELVPHEGHHKDHGYSSHSPVTDGKHVWAYFGSRGLHCYDMTGKRIWDKDLGRQSTRNSFGEGSSPALHGNMIVVNWDHEDEDFIAGFDSLSGTEKWRQPRDERTSWTTPLIVEHDGKAQVIVAGEGRVRSYDLASGKEIWHCRGLTANVIPTPVAKDGVVYLTSGFRGAALLAVKLGREGDLTGTDAILWTYEKATPYVPSPLLAGDRLYLFSGNSGTLSSFDIKTGKPVIETQRIDALENVYASPVAAGGRLYLVGRDGTTVVMNSEGDKLVELAVNELDEPIDASPAIVGKQLFLRGQQHLYCIEEK